MTKDESTAVDSAPMDWDAYWRGTSDGASFSSGGINHSRLIEFWKELFVQRASNEALSIVDVASGNGAVVQELISVLGEANLNITCVDSSASALTALVKRFPSVVSCEADAKSIPLEKNSFELVTSQYGVEYAGIDAIYEMSSLVSKGGTLAIIAHHADGGIYEECQNAVSAVQRMQAVNFIPLAIKLLSTRFAVAKGGNPANYQSAKTQFAPAVLEMKTIMLEFGNNVAGNTIKRLYDDVAMINQRVENYDQEEVSSWLNNMAAEMDAYIGRMQSMCDAALSAEQFADVCNELNQLGFSFTTRKALIPKDGQLPLAWSLVAKRT